MPEAARLNDIGSGHACFPATKPIYVYLKSTARDEPGTVTGQREILTGEGKWLEAASSGLGALIPTQIADKLNGKTFTHFDQFRKAFWLAIANDPELSSQFNILNIERMKQGQGRAKEYTFYKKDGYCIRARKKQSIKKDRIRLLYSV
ncbi:MULTISPECIES: hypothetical protein [Lonsdalea]|uniref:Uncharacterized protein n=2 Tax=Lonsdalea TaxID=1082702 RepID=A0ACD1JBJ8_9GAMM|nr:MULTISPECIES: hypothetical protein [Lonsdalea]OSM96095.1 hypothetical protein AU508_09590 [Lonsdalea populi]OSN01460.1 hypothetical protein AU499_06130 [Lonsdalea populi]QPQ22788.1 hypothetical protein I6N93_08700 [Lonsdalea populi]RAT12936.1 hypothetical protein AU485_10230 [Lonsdalea quercina]RAT15299.1 hypothetical protein AU486_10290 [Lonsdalea quercina]